MKKRIKGKSKKKAALALSLYYPGSEYQETPAEGPTEIGGQPVKYFWKDILHVGDYQHPVVKANRLIAPVENLQKWEQTGNEMLRAGVTVPINYDHSDSAHDTAGYVKKFELRGDTLYALCQLIGEKNIEAAAANKCSVGIKHVIDGERRDWGDCIWHLALTPLPLMPNQDDFKVAASLSDCLHFSLDSDGDTDPEAEQAVKSDEENSIMNLKCSEETIDQLHKLVPGLKDAHDDDKLARVAQHLHTMSMDDAADAGAGGDVSTMSLVDVHEKATAVRKQWKENYAPPVSGEVKEVVNEALNTKLDMAFSKGAINQPTKVKLASLLTAESLYNKKDGKTLSLSLVDALLENKPVEVKELSGAQVLVKNNAADPVLKAMADMVSPRK